MARRGYKQSPDHVEKRMRAQRKYPQLASFKREYRAWQAMINRCENPNMLHWENYGGRGITIAPVWRQSFQQFLDDMGPCPSGFSLDRIDNNGPYTPGNCRWTDRTTQSRNSRRVRLVMAHGLTLSLVEWAERVGIPAARIRDRLNAGWSPERALDPTPGDDRRFRRRVSG